MSLMTAFEATSRAIARAAQRLAAEEFTCSQCDRNARCGLAPRPDCIHRLTLIAEGRDYPAQPARWPASQLVIW